MQTTIHSPISKKETQEIQLHPNQLKVGANRLLLFFIMIILPVLLSAALFYSELQWNITNSLLGVLVVTVIMIGWYKSILQQQQAHSDITLLLKSDEVVLMVANEIKAKATLDELEVKICTWGMDKDNLRPAIQLKGEYFPKYTIGTMHANYLVIEDKNTLEYTDFLVSNSEDWETLKNYFAQ